MEWTSKQKNLVTFQHSKIAFVINYDVADTLLEMSRSTIMHPADINTICGLIFDLQKRPGTEITEKEHLQVKEDLMDAVKRWKEKTDLIQDHI